MIQLVRLLLVLSGLLGGAIPLVAQRGIAAGKPPFQPIRYQEDYRYLSDSLPSTSLLEAVKYIPLGKRRDHSLSLGGQSRQLYEHFRNAGWLPVGHDGYYLHRYYLHADLHLGRHTRLFGEAGSGWERGRWEGPRPIDEDPFFIHQAFAELTAFRSDEPRLLVRAGRQEVLFGSGRMITFREFPNLRLSHDGIRLHVHAPRWQLSTFVFRPVTNRQRALDNPFLDPRQTFWGFYGQWEKGWLDGRWDLYYLGTNRRQSLFQQGKGSQVRHSAGFRWWRKQPGWQYDLETVYQRGRFGDGKATPESLITAWALMLEAGYAWPDKRFKPQIGVKANVISGDHDPRPGSGLQTFQPLFPNPAYFSQAALFGLSNIRDLHPSLGLCLTKSLSLAVDYDWVWRDSKADGLYAPDGNLRRDGTTGRKRFVGRQLQAEASWQPNRHLKAAMIYVHCWPEAFLLDGQPSGVEVDFVNAYVRFLF
jgi:hypothetical protein